MVRRHISDDIKQLTLSMSLQGIPDSEIRELTGVSERSLKTNLPTAALFSITHTMQNKR
jgi:hypothetical protein